MGHRNSGTQEKGINPGKTRAKGAVKPRPERIPIFPEAGNQSREKEKTEKGKTQFGKSGKKTGKGIYSLDENAAETNPNETWPDSEEPYHEIGSLFMLTGNHPETKFRPERTQKCYSSEGKRRNGKKDSFIPVGMLGSSFSADDSSE